MLALIGALAIVSLLALILSNRTSPLSALILVPVVAALLVGLGAAVPGYIVAGIAKIAPVAGMFVFAILFFGIMTDVGLLAPLVSLVLRLVGEKPTRIAVGTALLALLIHLDGSGAVCFLVTIPALRPLYDRLGMDRRVLACTASMAAGVNFLPWTGPTLRAAAALKVPVTTLFTPMIGVQFVGLAFVFAAAWWLGRAEERRLASGIALPSASGASTRDASPEQGHRDEADALSLRRPRLLPFNVALTLVVVGVMIAGIMEPVVVFMVGTAVALLVNYPDAAQQRARIDAHARAALLMAGILLAAGAFTGIMTGSGMIGAMADTAALRIPEALGSRLPVLVGVLAMPLSLVFDPDSFYFGVLPVIARVAESFGTPAISVGQAALLGQMTTGFPVSPLTPATFLVAGLSGIELGAHQRFAIPWLFAASLVMVIAAVLFGVLPL
ncbi:citrate:proton symporter [Sphingomonas sp. LR60]|uniref:CitMHS family transporter n=1 Tax=Sphingomonas sp. LR60 TaxID=3050233 RepID=UPI002FE24F99